MKVTQGFPDHAPLVGAGFVRAAAVIGLLEGSVGQFQIEVVAGCLIGPWGLGGRTHAGAAEQIGEGRMVLPVAEDARQPAWPPEEGMLLQAGAAPEEVVAAAGALLTAIKGLLPAAQPHPFAGPLQQP